MITPEHGSTMKLPNGTFSLRMGVVFAAVALAGVPAPCVAQTAWWNSGWSCRRAVQVAPAGATKAAKPPPGDDVAWVVVPTGGMCRPDFADVRVATGTRQEVPSTVLMGGPGDFVKVAFALKPSARTKENYYVYFGNANPPAAAKELDIRRGVLMETKLHRGRAPVALSAARIAFARSKPLLGRTFVPRIFQGHNPFGPQINIVSRFTGWLHCPRQGTYQFASSSRDASFLLIDDKLVVANGGEHWPQRDIRKRGDVKLTAGVHKLTFYHVNRMGDPVVVAAWREPGGVRVWPIAPEAFLPVTEAQCGPMEQYGKRSSASFTAAAAGETFFGGRYYQRWAFEAAVAPHGGGKMTYAWDFGDGQKADGPRAEHVYFVSGDHKVSLTVRRGAETLVYHNVVHNTRLWNRSVRGGLDRPAHHAKIVAGYDFAALSAEANANAVLLLDAARLTDATRKAGQAMLIRSAGPTDPLLEEAMAAIAAAMPPEVRAPAYLRAERLAQSAGARAGMAVRAAREMLEEQADPNAAWAVYRRVVREYGSAASLPAVRAAKIGLGDVWRVRGNLAEAAKAYAAVGLGPDVEPARVEIAKGGYARHVEQYLRQEQFADADEQIDAWGLNIPADKLEGYWSLLVVKKCLAEKDYAAAAREAAVLANVNPRSNYAAQLLMMAAEAYAKLGKSDAASAALKRIVERYPESPLAKEAAEKLKR